MILRINQYQQINLFQNLILNPIKALFKSMSLMINKFIILLLELHLNIFKNNNISNLIVNNNGRIRKSIIIIRKRTHNLR
jgi:hypothetical protein